MDTLQIMLANGHPTHSDKLREYFTGIFRAEESGEEYPVELAHIWPIGYTRKDSATRALENNPDFTKGIDYQVFRTIAENSEGGRPVEEYHLTVSCAEFLAVRANREVFEVYRQCRKTVRDLLKNPLPDFSDPVAGARAWADAYEAKQLAEARATEAQRQLMEATPKIVFAESVAVSANALSFAQAAKMLKIAALAGRNRLVAQLKADHILLPSREPYQQYVDQGYFEVQLLTYQPGPKAEKGAKGTRVAGTTRITPKGHPLRALPGWISSDRVGVFDLPPAPLKINAHTF